MQNWKRRGRGERMRITTRFDAHEARLLRSLASSVHELLADRASSVETDELTALTGIQTGHSTAPDDAVLARLLPNFHRSDDGSDVAHDDLNSGLRSLHEPTIIDVKSTAAQVILDTVPDNGGPIGLTPDQAHQWLGALNDIRLALGTTLGVDENTPEQLPPNDPHAVHLDAYNWLTVVQELLVIALMGRA